jgi:hypothetical protein
VLLDTRGDRGRRQCKVQFALLIYLKAQILLLHRLEPLHLSGDCVDGGRKERNQVVAFRIGLCLASQTRAAGVHAHARADDHRAGLIRDRSGKTAGTLPVNCRRQEKRNATNQQREQYLFFRHQTPRDSLCRRSGKLYRFPMRLSPLESTLPVCPSSECIAPRLNSSAGWSPEQDAPDAEAKDLGKVTSQARSCQGSCLQCGDENFFEIVNAILMIVAKGDSNTQGSAAEGPKRGAGYRYSILVTGLARCRGVIQFMTVQTAIHGDDAGDFRYLIHFAQLAVARLAIYIRLQVRPMAPLNTGKHSIDAHPRNRLV